VDKIVNTPTGSQDKPAQEVKINSIKIERS